MFLMHDQYTIRFFPSRTPPNTQLVPSLPIYCSIHNSSLPFQYTAQYTTRPFPSNILLNKQIVSFLPVHCSIYNSSLPFRNTAQYTTRLFPSSELLNTNRLFPNGYFTLEPPDHKAFRTPLKLSVGIQRHTWVRKAVVLAHLNLLCYSPEELRSAFNAQPSRLITQQLCN